MKTVYTQHMLGNLRHSMIRVSSHSIEPSLWVSGSIRNSLTRDSPTHEFMKLTIFENKLFVPSFKCKPGKHPRMSDVFD